MLSDSLALIAALPIPAVLIGQDERIEATNAAAAQLFGHDGTGRHYITVLRQPATLDVVEGTLRDGQPREGHYLGRDGGRDSTWRASARSVAFASGRHVLVTFEDVTAVEEAGQIRRDFVANVSHELRTPLTALLGFLETLRGPARDDPAARERFLGIATREAQRMARLVDDLLSLSQVEAEERRRPTGQVDLRALTASVAASLEPLAGQAGAELRLDLPEARMTVPGDEGQLRQVLTNLVENAIKYGGHGGPVEIALTGPAEEPSLRRNGLRLSVTDRGPGIATHHIPRLTERFYRVDTHRSREVGGTGLGLAIVKHIVNRHHGRLMVESDLGKGSRFTVVLPAE
ncbi:Phosphate regulon sensor protein PhoR (SphS) [Rubellimicrobium mesophilum DSM 19309]|uniref:histidine kinase n=1 Tax=Rubellimicrobium mesophilum DSM 19309 TaxID=442562 RepID=A0A017HGE8_9RHOB|nr:ATP-binding protein [Rubellimicrobium mesophilum]EYD73532.1 Phosphate regulon sensor protein PhoR (SphS) [Rubellimicrobium mesophilum DSM 19309]